MTARSKQSIKKIKEMDLEEEINNQQPAVRDMAEYLEDWDCQYLDVVQVRHHELLGSRGIDLSSDRGNIRGLLLFMKAITAIKRVHDQLYEVRGFGCLAARC